MEQHPIDTQELAAASRAIQQMAMDVDRIASKFVDQVHKTRDETVRAVEEVKGKSEKHLDAIDRKYKYFHDESITRIHLFGESWEKTIDRVDKKFKEFGEAIKRQLTEARAGLNGLGGAMGLTGGKGIMGSMGGIANGLMSQLPMGGLIGLMLFGKMKESEFAARGHAAARQFEAVGQVGAGVTKRLTGLVRSMWSNMMDEGQIAALSGAFAQFGVSGKEVLTNMGRSVKGFGSDVVGISFAMDTLTNAAAGTFASAIGSAMQTSGQAIKETTQDIVTLGLELRGTGLNVSQFISQLMQSTSALRFQAQGTDDLKKNVLALTAAYSNAGIKGPRLGAMVSGGMQALVGGVGGLSEGLAAVIGQRIGTRTGKPVSGVDAIIAMQEGTAGKSGNFMGEIVRELGRFAKEVTHGGNEASQKFALQKVAPSLGVEGARAVVEINKAMEKDMSKGMTYQEAVAKHATELNHAFQSKADETSDYQKYMRRMTDAMAKVGSGLLQVTIIGLASIGNSLSDLTTIMTPDVFLGEEAQALKDAAIGRSARSAQMMDAGWAQVGAGLSQMAMVTKGIIDLTFLSDLKKVRENPTAVINTNRQNAVAENQAINAAARGAWGDAAGHIPGYTQLPDRAQAAVRSAFKDSYTREHGMGVPGQKAFLTAQKVAQLEVGQLLAKFHITLEEHKGE